MDNRPHIMLGKPITIDLQPPRVLGAHDKFIEINGVKVFIRKPVDLDNAYVVTKKYNGEIYFAHNSNVKDTQRTKEAKIIPDLTRAIEFCDRRNAARQKIKYGVEKSNAYFLYNTHVSIHSTSNWDKPNYRYILLECSVSPIKINSYDKTVSLPKKYEYKKALKDKNKNDIDYHLKSIKDLEQRIIKEQEQVKEYQSVNNLIDTIDFDTIIETNKLRTDNQDQIELLYEVSK